MENLRWFFVDPRIDKPWGNTLREKLYEPCACGIQIGALRSVNTYLTGFPAWTSVTQVSFLGCGGFLSKASREILTLSADMVSELSVS